MLFTLKDYIKNFIPEDLLLGELVLRRSHAWRKAGIIFVHVPKNGGTSIRAALYGQYMGHYRVRDIECIRPDLLRKLPSFALTRNPWARAYSAYSFARRSAEMVDGVNIWNPSRYKKPEFSTFERFVLEWLPSRNLDREDYVFRSQAHYLLNREGEVGVEHLGRIEEPKGYIAFLNETLGRSVDIGHLNRSTDAGQYRKEYTPEMRDSLGKSYSIDIGKFGYDF